MCNAATVRTWVGTAARHQLDRKARQKIEDNLRSYESRHGRNASLDKGALKGWIFGGYPAAATAFINAHPAVLEPNLEAIA